MRKVFTHSGYNFYSDGVFWNVSKVGEKPPKNLAYRTPEAIAKLKNIRLKKGK